MTSLNKDEFGRLDPTSLYITSGHDWLGEDIHITEKECRSQIDELCGDGETPRCEMLDNDSDNYSFGQQCNLGKDHDGDHAFGINSMLWYLGPKPGEPRCTDDEHVGTCSVCLVREVRGK